MVSVGVSIVVVGQFFHVNWAGIIRAIHAMNVKAFAALESFVSSRWFLRSRVLNRRILHIIDNRYVDRRLRHWLVFVLQFPRQRL